MLDRILPKLKAGGHKVNLFYPGLRDEEASWTELNSAVSGDKWMSANVSVCNGVPHRGRCEGD